MKKIVSILFALLMMLGTVTAFGVSAAGIDEVNSETPDIVYTDHFTYNNEKGYDYDITGSVIAWVKQAKGALIWVPADDTRIVNEVIAQAKNADPSLANATEQFAVLRGEGTLKTPNTNGSQATITVYTNETGKLTMSIKGAYSHFVSGTPTDPIDPPSDPNPGTDESDKANIRIDTPKKMAVKFADGTIYYGGEMKEVVVGKEYMFQMASVNWENGRYDENGNGICGTVVYRMKVIHAKEFNELRAEAVNETEKYTVKGIDIINNDAKTIIINCDAEGTHLQTDVNNFFVAYRFHFKNGDYNKQTGIMNVINTPLESLSVNLPFGVTVTCDAYKAYQLIDTDSVFITRNNGEGEYADMYLTSVNDYYWNH